MQSISGPWRDKTQILRRNVFSAGHLELVSAVSSLFHSSALLSQRVTSMVSSTTFAPAIFASSMGVLPRWISWLGSGDLDKLAILSTRICGVMISPKPAKAELEGTEIAWLKKINLRSPRKVLLVKSSYSRCSHCFKKAQRAPISSALKH